MTRNENYVQIAQNIFSTALPRELFPDLLACNDSGIVFFFFFTTCRRKQYKVENNIFDLSITQLARD